MKIYKVGEKALILSGSVWFELLSIDWDTFLNRENLRNKIEIDLEKQTPLSGGHDFPIMGNVYAALAEHESY